MNKRIQSVSICVIYSSVSICEYSEMVSKRKDTSVTFQGKVEVLKRLNNGESASKLAIEFEVENTTNSDWKKKQSTIEVSYFFNK